MTLRRQSSFLMSFDKLFLLSKALGLVPQSIDGLLKKESLIPSRIGKIYMVVVMISVFLLYNVLIYSVLEEDRSLRAQQSTLTFVIGMFLNYITPVMLLVDQIMGIRNEKRLGELFNRFIKIDFALAKQGIFPDNDQVKRRYLRSFVFLFITDLSITLGTFFMVIRFTSWSSLIWFVITIPSFLSAVDKIWFGSILHGIKQRFAGLNDDLEMIVKDMKEKTFRDTVDLGSDFNLGYLHKEIFSNKKIIGLSSGDKKRKISPIEINDLNVVTLHPSVQPIVATISATKKSLEPIFTDIVKLENKLNSICQLHDELCEIGKFLNELWAIQILILMAYGFLQFTAQLYFFYCAGQDQPIPYLFRSAGNTVTTTLLLFYVSWRTVYFFYSSWQTSLECKRTGTCLHKVGVAADNNDVYEIVNHISLKLLNHTVNFSACGFFSLDMETLYGVAGGITSYLIILIQFNLAGQQQKDAIHKGDWNVTNPVNTERAIVGSTEL